MYIHPVTGCRAPYVPMGRFIHVPPPFPRSDWANNFGRPWWRDDQYYVGLLTAKTRQIRIVNMLTLQEQTIEVRCVPITCYCPHQLHKMYSTCAIMYMRSIYWSVILLDVYGSMAVHACVYCVVSIRHEFIYYTYIGLLWGDHDWNLGTLSPI